MKRILQSAAFVLLATVLFYVSCKKEYSCENCIGNNKPPVAHAGKDTTIILPVDSMILDGRASTDDKKIISYQWTKISGPDTFKIVKPTVARTTVNKLVKGVFEFELKVTDAEGLFSKDTVQVAVNATTLTNHPPVACAGSDRTITLPTDTVTLDGSCSTDPDNSIASYAWAKISGPSSFNIVNVNAVATQVSKLTEGTYHFELKVTDAGGLFSKDTVQVTVQPAQQTEVCDISNRATITIQLVPVAAIPTPRYGIVIATAGNKLLLAGGRTGPGGTPVSDVDIYDFGTQTWSTAHLSTARADMMAVTVGNKIFFAAGEAFGIAATTRVDIYDASTNTWSSSDLPSPASIVYSYAVVGNKVFFVTDRAPDGGKVDVCDTSTGLWSEINLPEHQAAPAATAVGDKVYFAGGWVNYPSNKLSNVVDIYDNTTGTWSTTSSLSQPIGEMASIYVNGKIYWAGGVIGYDAARDKDIATCKVEIRDVSTGSSSFTNLSAPNDFTGNWGKPIYYNSKIIFWGDFDIYDPKSSTWSISQFPQNVFIESVILVNNALYAIGSNHYNSGSSDQIWKLQF